MLISYYLNVLIACMVMVIIVRMPAEDYVFLNLCDDFPPNAVQLIAINRRLISLTESRVQCPKRGTVGAVGLSNAGLSPPV
jgi:hypothetical protein